MSKKHYYESHGYGVPSEISGRTTLCGYVRDDVTRNENEVTCAYCKNILETKGKRSLSFSPTLLSRITLLKVKRVVFLKTTIKVYFSGHKPIIYSDNEFYQLLLDWIEQKNQENSLGLEDLSVSPLKDLISLVVDINKSI